MDPITDVAIPVLTVCAMFVVGLELSVDDFARLAQRPRKLVVATVAQAALLPLVAFVAISLLDPPLYRTLGLIVIAGCPGGAFSNFFTALAQGKTALSVALTTTCTLVAVVTLPVVTAVGFALFVSTDQVGVVRPPVLLMIGQLLVLLVLPLLFGMALRLWWETPFTRIRPRLHQVVLAGIVALIVWIFVDRAADVATEFIPGVVAASLFLVPAMLLGELLGRILQEPPEDRFAYVVEFGFRNLGLAIVVTVTLLRQPSFLAFATVFFVTAVLYALFAVVIFRSLRRA